MKNIFVSMVTAFLVLVSAMPTLAAVDIGAQQVQQIGQTSGYDSGSGVPPEQRLPQTVGLIIRVALSLIGTIFLVLTIYAGFLWMTAGGNAEAIETSQSIIKAAIVGLIIVLLAYSITTFVTTKLLQATQQ